MVNMFMFSCVVCGLCAMNMFMCEYLCDEHVRV